MRSFVSRAFRFFLFMFTLIASLGDSTRITRMVN